MRLRLISCGNAAKNSATNLLFALLCLCALEACETSPREPSHAGLIRSIRLAISIYGQSFLLDPPTDRDSIVACLLLSDYMPAALATSQSAAHTTVKSSLFIHLAYRIAERLELMPYQTILVCNSMASSAHWKPCLVGALQGLQIYCREALLDGFITKPLRAMHRVLKCVKSALDSYSGLLQGQHCSLQMFYHIQSIMGDYLVMKSLADMKQNWDELGNLTLIIEDARSKRQEQVALIKKFLSEASDHEKSEEIWAALCLLELRYHLVLVTVYGMGLVYATVLKVRLESDRVGVDSDIQLHEGVQLARHVIESFKSSPESRAQSITRFMNRFGVPYPTQLEAILERFINCAETLKSDGVRFRPPPRYFALETVRNCKNLVENNILQLNGFGKLHPNFEKQLQLLAQCTQALENMATSQWETVDVAFSNGCLYAAAVKMINGLHDLMLTLRARVFGANCGPQDLGQLEAPTYFDGLHEPDLDFAINEWNWGPHIDFNFSEMIQEQAEQPFDLRLFPELD